MSGGLMGMLLARSEQGDEEATALLKGLMAQQQGVMGPGTGAMDALRRPVIDPQTGQQDQFRAKTGEIVKRGDVLPVGVNDSGQVRPALPSIITGALEPQVKLAGDIAQGKRSLYDPTTGGVADDAIETSTKQALGMMGGGLPTGALPGAGIPLGSGLIRKTASTNLGMGKPGRGSMEAEAAAAAPPKSLGVGDDPLTMPKATPEHAKFPEYAEPYPPPVPGEMVPDPKSGKVGATGPVANQELLAQIMKYLASKEGR